LVTLGRIRAILWAIILSELVVTTYSIFASSDVTWMAGRMFGVSKGILGWNFLGIAAAMTIPYIAALCIARPSFIKSALLAAATGAMFWMLVLTASRSGMMDVAVSIVLTSFFVLRGSSRGRLIGVGIIVALLVTVSLAPSMFWERMATISTVDPDVSSNTVEYAAVSSTEDRYAILMRSIDYTIHHPIFGLGLGNLAVASGNQLGDPDAWSGSHNTYTEISSEAGIPALLLFFALIATALLTMRRVSQASIDSPQAVELKLMARATVASILSFMFAGFFAHLGYEYFFYTCPVAIAVGLGLVARSMQTAASAPSPQAPIIQQHLNTAWIQ
jgi:O-antigen ligase